MGAHSLGGASKANSGYQGKWTGPRDPGFNELFFKNMIDPAITWTNVVSNLNCFESFPLLFVSSCQQG